MINDNVVVPTGFVDNLFDIRDRVIVVTGGGSGLGAAMATGFAQAGALVVLADIDHKGAQTTAELIKAQGGSAFVRQVDVTKRHDVDAFALWASDNFPQIDALVNNAGVAFRAPAEEFPENEFDKIIALNLKGTYLCCQAFGRVMLEQGSGSIVNIASIGAFIAYPLSSAYIASKGAVVQATRALALEWRSRGVRVNAIAPSLMETKGSQVLEESTSITSEFIMARMLVPKLGQPRDLIGTAIYLVSDASLLVTGATIVCDDGYLCA